MTIARVILIHVPEGKAPEAEKIWKQECSGLLRRQKGCRLEKFMKSMDRPNLYISYSEWDSMAEIEAYRSGADHEVIRQEARALQGGRAVVWCYEILTDS